MRSTLPRHFPTPRMMCKIFFRLRKEKMLYPFTFFLFFDLFSLIFPVSIFFFGVKSIGSSKFFEFISDSCKNMSKEDCIIQCPLSLCQPRGKQFSFHFSQTKPSHGPPSPPKKREKKDKQHTCRYLMVYNNLKHWWKSLK